MLRPKHFPLALSCLFLFIALNAHVVAGKDTWTSVQSKNFFLIGNGSEKEIRQVAVRLEQFRDVFTYLFPRMRFTTPVSTTVVVFKSESSYRPFKPGPNLVGYFQAGEDVNYITLTTELNGTQDPFNVIFHEYTHLLVNNTMGRAPAWFNEGLAEYYSTFNISNDQKFELGKAIGNHVYLLRDSKMLPFRTLFEVDHKSPHYNERNKQSIFYAESWALMHYLIIGKEGMVDRLGKFVDLLSTSVSKEDAFQQAFQMTFEEMEKELRTYVQKDRYNVLQGHFRQKLETDKTMTSAPISEAEAQAYLGDLLLHSNRKDSEVYLEKALSLDPNLAMANASMGMAKLRDGKPDEALKHLQKAVEANSQNYLAHYYYAMAMSRGNANGPRPVAGFAPETSAKIRKELLRAIELRPDFPASYSLLCFISLVSGEHLDEARTLLTKAFKNFPGRSDLAFMLGQLYLRTGDYKQARQHLEQVVKSNADDETRQHAQQFLTELTSVEEQLKQQTTARNAPRNETVVTRTEEAPSETKPTVASTDPSSYLVDVLRKPREGETQLQGTLIRVECVGKSIFFIVKSGEKTLRLRAAGFEGMEITTYDPKVTGEITCGVPAGAESVIVCFVAKTDARQKTDGEIKSIEFVPKTFKLTPS